jgi:hypothetical protein
MARGWESKSVEAQMEAAESRSGPARPELSESEIALARQRENLQLSRTRVARELETSKNPRYVSLLTRELKVLDEKLSQLI